MALIPLWDNVWGVAIYERPYREQATIHTPFARQRKKLTNMVLVKEVGEKCRYVQVGDVVILPEDHGGAITTIINAGGEIEYRYVFKETQALAVWEGGLPEHASEAGVINLEDQWHQ